jgi:hypothetical protein
VSSNANAWLAAPVVFPELKHTTPPPTSAATMTTKPSVAEAELYDPATNAWTAPPDMAHKRCFAAICVLPSGRVAVMGGTGADGQERKDGEAFDPAKQTPGKLNGHLLPFARSAARCLRTSIGRGTRAGGSRYSRTKANLEVYPRLTSPPIARS